MAEEDEGLSLDNGDDVKSGGKKKLIIIIIAVVLLLGGGGGAYFFFFMGDDSQVAADQQVAEKAPSNESLQSASYVPMPRPFVFNVMDGKRQRLVQIKVQLLIRGNDKVTLAKKHTPLLEDTLVRVFSAASADQLRSPSGKAEIRALALKSLNEVTTKYENQALIDTVLFTGFVLQ